MRAVDVTLGGQVVTLRIPVPSKIMASLDSLKAETLEGLEAAYVGVLATHAVDWRWPREPVQAWAEMWEEGVSWVEVQDAVALWVGACNSALGGLVEAAKAKEATFPDGPAGDGDRQP